MSKEEDITKLYGHVPDEEQTNEYKYADIDLLGRLFFVV